MLPGAVLPVCPAAEQRRGCRAMGEAGGGSGCPGQVRDSRKRVAGNSLRWTGCVGGLYCHRFGSCSDSSADANFLLFSLILHQLQTLLWK